MEAKNINLRAPGRPAGERVVNGLAVELRELLDSAGCFRGALDYRTAPVLEADLVLFTERLDLAGPVIIVSRQTRMDTVEWLVAERRPLPDGHWVYLPCAEGFAPLTSYDAGVEVVGVVVEVRRGMVLGT